jgi:molecular chaperone HscA
MIQIEDVGYKKKTLSHKAIGIDFGTTHTVVAVKDDQGLSILEFEEGYLVPSVISKDGDTFIFGASALNHKDALHSIKRLMKEPLQKPKFERSVLELTTEFLKYIKCKIENILKEKVSDVVITVPAYFDDAARQSTKDAAFLAGFNVLRLLNEPTAAALSYGLDTQKEGLYLVYDLGGGTFDVSLLKMNEGVFQVIATGGDTNLGGDDIDIKILKELNLEKNAQNIITARSIKHHISENESDVKEFTKGQLLTLSCSLIQTTLKICDQVLKDAKVLSKNLEGIVLCGGSTRLLGLKEALKQHYGVSLFDDLDPDLSVAKGAALQSYMLQKGEGVLLLDVTPLSLGIETMGGLFEKIIDRNTPIPVQKAQDFTTYKDGQTSLKIHVLQGERELAKDCRSLYTFIFSNIPALPSGAAKIRITFSLDTNGILNVKAKELYTNIEQTVDIQPSYGLAQNDILKMLYESHQFAKDDLEHRLLQESIIDVEHLLGIVQKAILSDGDMLTLAEKEKIESMMKDIEKAVFDKNRSLILELKEKLSAETQSFAEKRLERAIQKQLLGSHI